MNIKHLKCPELQCLKKYMHPWKFQSQDFLFKISIWVWPESLSNIVLEACLFSRCFFVPPALSSHPLTAVMPSKPSRQNTIWYLFVWGQKGKVPCYCISTLTFVCKSIFDGMANCMVWPMHDTKDTPIFTYGRKNTLSILCHWLLELSPSSRKCRCTCQWQQVFSEITHNSYKPQPTIAQAILKLEIYWKWKAYVKKEIHKTECSVTVSEVLRLLGDSYLSVPHEFVLSLI